MHDRSPRNVHVQVVANRRDVFCSSFYDASSVTKTK
jgi:hypothetical protein